jgi:hypothetical protein
MAIETVDLPTRNGDFLQPQSHTPNPAIGTWIGSEMISGER